MIITKYGHSCLLVEEGDARILIDPGKWSEGHTALTNLHAILITHEHQDHCDVSSLQEILKKNPDILIYTNHGVGTVLVEADIAFQPLEDGGTVEIQGIMVRAYGRDHALIHETMPVVRNTGYMIADRFFYGGDSITVFPDRPVEILALPVVAPWMRLAESLDYAVRLKPKHCFPVHDGMLKYTGPFHVLPQKILNGAGIEWGVLEHGKPMEF